MGGESLHDHRRRIAAIDAALLDLVAQRVRSARAIGLAKRQAGTATLDPAREAAVVRGAVERGRALGLAEEPVREMFWILIRLCRDVQIRETES
jgi:chorismate mutase